MTDQERKAMEMAFDALLLAAHTARYTTVIAACAEATDAIRTALQRPVKSYTNGEPQYATENPMTDLRKAAEMALEALENAPIEYDFHGNPMDAEFGKQSTSAIEALRQALAQGEQTEYDKAFEKEFEQYAESDEGKARNKAAQPEQEPVAWMFEEYAESSKGYMKWFKCIATQKPQDISEIYRNITPLYTAPVSKPWVSLTFEETKDIWITNSFNPYKISRDIEAKLKEKNNG